MSNICGPAKCADNHKPEGIHYGAGIISFLLNPSFTAVSVAGAVKSSTSLKNLNKFFENHWSIGLPSLFYYFLIIIIRSFKEEIGLFPDILHKAYSLLDKTDKISRRTIST